MSSNIIRPDLTFSFTRPADTLVYAAGDQVANSVTAGSVTPMVFTGAAIAKGRGCLIKAAYLYRSASSVTLADFRLALFNAAPTNIGDNIGYTGASFTEVKNMIGVINFASASLVIAYTNGAYHIGLPNTVNNIPHLAIPALPDGNLYGMLIANAAYVPANAEQFQIRLVVEQD